MPIPVNFSDHLHFLEEPPTTNTVHRTRNRQPPPSSSRSALASQSSFHLRVALNCSTENGAKSRLRSSTATPLLDQESYNRVFQTNVPKGAECNDVRPLCKFAQTLLFRFDFTLFPANQNFPTLARLWRISSRPTTDYSRGYRPPGPTTSRLETVRYVAWAHRHPALLCRWEQHNAQLLNGSRLVRSFGRGSL